MMGPPDLSSVSPSALPVVDFTTVRDAALVSTSVDVPHATGKQFKVCFRNHG